MNIEDVFNSLICGELSKHGMSVEGSFAESDKAILRRHINICLTELYTRYPLLVKALTIQQFDGICEYHLSSEYAVSNKQSTQEHKYIIDTILAPFTDDVVRVERVADEMGHIVPLNSLGKCQGVFTPSPLVIEIPNPSNENTLFVTYRAKHPVVLTDTTELLLPYTWLPALLAYVAYRVYSGGTSQEHMAISMNMHQKFEMICQQMTASGMTNEQDNSPNFNPDLRGWV